MLAMTERGDFFREICRSKFLRQGNGLKEYFPRDDFSCGRAGGTIEIGRTNRMACACYL